MTNRRLLRRHPEYRCQYQNRRLADLGRRNDSHALPKRLIVARTVRSAGFILPYPGRPFGTRKDFMFASPKDYDQHDAFSWDEAQMQLKNACEALDVLAKVRQWINDGSVHSNMGCCYCICSGTTSTGPSTATTRRAKS
ncbi:hypothetical protein DFH06DRAFT_1315690 [Mycena polygramma]|nr:hypothetical protein DFH06DRAFT_1315690 [Mycena polygramma]